MRSLRLRSPARTSSQHTLFLAYKARSLHTFCNRSTYLSSCSVEFRSTCATKWAENVNAHYFTGYKASMVCYLIYKRLSYHHAHSYVVTVHSPYANHNASVAFTNHNFSHHKDTIMARASQVSGCPESLSWVTENGIEVTSQGVKQGAPVKFGKPQPARSR